MTPKISKVKISPPAPGSNSNLAQCFSSRQKPAEETRLSRQSKDDAPFALSLGSKLDIISQRHLHLFVFLLIGILAALSQVPPFVTNTRKHINMSKSFVTTMTALSIILLCLILAIASGARTTQAHRTTLSAARHGNNGNYYNRMHDMLHINTEDDPTQDIRTNVILNMEYGM